jgi:hypothetical protein
MVLATFVLHLVPAALQQGSLVGRIECVESGDGQVCRHLEEFLDFLRAHAGPVPLSTPEDDQ